MKVYELDPKHKALLDDHSSGYWWIRPVKPANKYRGKVVFAKDIGEDLRKSFLRKVSQRRLYPWLSSFKKIGYVYRNVDFIKLMDAEEASLEFLEAAMKLKIELVKTMKAEAKLKSLLKQYPGYSGRKRVVKNPGSRQDQKLWVWSFKNESLGKEYVHIFHFKDEGMEVGKRRREFVERFGLDYESMKQLASGKRKSYEGWTLIDEPRQITRHQAIEWKIELIQKGSKY